MASTTAKSDLKELEANGIQAFRRNDFGSALETFTNAITTARTALKADIAPPGKTTVTNINSSSTTIMQTLHRLYDLRAATYEKLGSEELPSALLDAKAMIKVDRGDAKGYLRAGKILVLQGKDDAALKLYKYGLEEVEKYMPTGARKRKREDENGTGIGATGMEEADERERGKELLKGMMKKLEEKAEKIRAEEERQERLKQRWDFLQIFPMELVEIVCARLDFRSLIRCQSVCSTWRNFFRHKYPSTYQHLDFGLSSRRKPPRWSTIGTYLKLAGKRPSPSPSTPAGVISLTLSHLHDEGIPLLPKIISACARTLQSLHLTVHYSTSPLNSSLIEATNIGKNLRKVELECPTYLRILTKLLPELPELRELIAHHVISPGQVDAKTPLWFQQRAEKLEKLHLNAQQLDPATSEWNAQSMITRMHELGLEKGYLSHMPNLTSLTLLNWAKSDTLPKWDFTHVTKLKELCVKGTTFYTYPLLPPTVTHLTLAGNFHSPPSIVASEDELLTTPLPKLEYLCLSHNGRARVETVEKLLGVGEFKPKAEDLEPDMEGEKQKSSTSQDEKESPRPPLRYLDLSNCPRLIFHDLDWLLSDGICDGIETLNVASLPAFGDHVSRDFSRLGYLREIDMSRTRITGVGLINIVMMAGRKRSGVKRKAGEKGEGKEVGVEKVSVIGCAVGMDAIEKVRGLGVVVRYIDPYSAGGGLGKGKKVRYGD